MTRKQRVWIDVGSHGKVFYFSIGPVADRYPDLMQIYLTKKPGLIPGVLTYEWPSRTTKREADR